MSGGGGLRHFFRTATSLESHASPQKADERGGGGGDSDFFQKVSKGGGGHGPDVPPSKSATVQNYTVAFSVNILCRSGAVVCHFNANSEDF